jgi:hypothetical protein
MADTSPQASSLEASSESVKLNASGAVAPSTPVQTRPQAAANVPPAIVSPNFDSKEAFLDFCKQYAPYMQYSALIDREVRFKSRCRQLKSSQICK